jgi:hypothetical protein
MNQKFSIMKKITIEAIKKMWIVFSLVFVTAVIISSLLGDDSLLTTDDPYIIALILSLPCIGLALVYAIADNFKPKWLKHLLTVCYLVLWVLYWVRIDRLNQDTEAAGIATCIAAGSLITGIIGWIICLIRFPKWFFVVVSIACVFFLINYAVINKRYEIRQRQEQIRFRQQLKTKQRPQSKLFIETPVIAVGKYKILYPKS